MKLEGPTLNKGIISLKNCLESLSGKNNHLAFYESSTMTRLMKDALGGNSYSVSFFCLNQGESYSSLILLWI